MAIKQSSSSIQPQPRIFLSYARKDGEEFARELRGKIESHGLSVWQDRKEIEGTKKWWAQIEEAIQSVEYMVLVMTEAALGSEIVQREWKFARQEGKGVIPVIGSKELDFDKMPRWMKEEHFVDVDQFEQWERFLRTLEGPHQSICVKYIEDKLPDNFIERPREFEPLLKALLDSGSREAIAITATLQGAGGFGKTILARALCLHSEVKETYFDGIHCITIGETPGDLTGRVLDLIERISGQRPGFETLERASDRLAELLANHTMLLVIDDVWDPTHLKPFLKGGMNCTRLITTRNKNVVPSNAISVVVDRMGTEESVALLEEALPDGSESRLQDLANRLGHWPLLLNLAASAMREGRETGESATGILSYIEEGLSEEGLTAFDVNNEENRNMAVEATIKMSMKQLEQSSRDRFRELCIFPEDTRIPFRALEVYWRQTGALTSFQVKKVVRELSRFSLLWEVNLDDQYLQLHDVFRDYLRFSKKNEMVKLQSSFLDEWKGNQTWASQGESSSYIWQHIAWHLIEAERHEELESLCLNFSWLQAKLEATDPAALLKDFDLLNDNEAVEIVAGAIRLSAHVLGEDPAQFPGQLIGRLLLKQRPKIQNLLNQVREGTNRPWLRPLQESLIAPGGLLIRSLRADGSGGIIVTPDGTRVILASGDGTCKIFDSESWEVVQAFNGVPGWNSMVMVPGGTEVISAAHDGTCKIWSLLSGKVIQTLRGHISAVNAVTITPDGTRAISASDDHTCKVWNLVTGQEVYTMAEHRWEVTAVTVTLEGRQVISASRDFTTKVWDLESGQVVQTFNHGPRVNAMVMVPGGMRVISASEDHTCKVWDLVSGQVAQILKGHLDSVTAVTVTSDGTRAISASGDGTCKVWNLLSGKVLQTFRADGSWMTAVTVTPDGAQAISASDDYSCKVWDLASVYDVQDLRGHEYEVVAVTVAPNGLLAVSASRDGTCKVWDLESGQVLQVIKDDPIPNATSMIMVPGGMRIILNTTDNIFTVWDLMSGQVVHRLKGHGSPVTAVTVTTDGTRAISTSGVGSCEVWDLENGQVVQTFEIERSVNAMVVVPGGRRIFFGLSCGMCEIWDLSSGQKERTFGGSHRGINAVAVTSDGRRAISASDDHTCTVWDLESGQEVQILRGHSHSVKAVTLTPENNRVISGAEWGEYKVWDLASGKELQTLSGRISYQVTPVVVTLDGKRMISPSRDSMCKVWDLASGEEIATFTGESPVSCCAVTPDGRIIVIGESSGRVHFLRLEGSD